MSITTRVWKTHDVPAVLELMRELAVFEDYINDFQVNQNVLLEQGFYLEPPNFFVLVAEQNSSIVGILVYYFLPFTFTAKPALFIKELFVSEHARGSGAGRALMRHACKIAMARGCYGMKWTVANWNEAGKKFYESLGAMGDPVWVSYGISGEAFLRLAET